jgi:catechol 2,3-dioxygenase-like lactoylglutathione lyase family enzyme
MLTIASFVWGTRDIPTAVAFWTAALNYRPREEPDDDWATLVPTSGEGPRFSLMLVNSEGPRRHHLDLYADDVEAEIFRLESLGASRVLDWDYPHDADYVVLKDPDGNTFCVVERPTT